MVNSCAVPLCTNRYKPGSDIQFYRLPLKKPKLLKIWLQLIWCESIPVNEYTRVCSAHFSGNPKRLGPNDIPRIFAWSKPTTPRPTTKGRSTVLRYDGGESWYFAVHKWNTFCVCYVDQLPRTADTLDKTYNFLVFNYIYRTIQTHFLLHLYMQ